MILIKVGFIGSYTFFFHVQDQLDDAQRPGEEKNEENRDCKEEEKGVNMTDDFDSHLQDVEKKGEFYVD